MTSSSLTRRRSWPLAVVLTAALALPVAGCGDDEPAAARHPSTSGQLAGSGFAKRADEVLCKRARRVVKIALGHVLSGDQDGADREVLRALHASYDELAALPVLPEDEATVGRLLSAMSDALEEADADPSIVSDGGDSFGDVDRLFAEQGIDDCA
jgi:hypothetical protein